MVWCLSHFTKNSWYSTVKMLAKPRKGEDITEILTKQLTPWSRVLEKLTVTQLVKKFPTFYGTQMFITVSTRAYHWSLS
jgi:hypothetical protein